MSPATVATSTWPGALTVAVDDVRDTGVAEPAEAEPEVERRAEHHDDVGALLEEPARAQERQLVRRRERPAPEAIEEARHPKVLDGRPQLLPRTVPVDVAADDERRPLGLGEHPRDRRDLVRVRLAARPAVERGSSPDAGPNTSSGKSRNVGPRCALVASTAAACAAAPARVGVLDGERRLGDRRDHGHVIHLLERSRPHRPSGARPPMTTSGDPLNQALVMAETPLVIPGPAVSAANPGLRVSFAHASAANVAVCS
jgi:hypothetical protein